jgi:hypothetical protein
MVDLAPTAADAAKYPTGADSKIYLCARCRERAALAADRIEHIADDVERVVVELDLHLPRTVKNPFIDRTNFRPAALDVGVAALFIPSKGPSR